MFDIPYFFTNEDWYEILLDNDDVPCVRLTNRAPQKAIDSYEEYFNKKAKVIEVTI